MDYATALENLNIDLKDTDNFTFTTEEKQRALTEAWNDPYNVGQVWDETTTYSTSTYRYTIPTGIDYMKGLYYKPTSTSFPIPVSSEAYEVVNGEFIISPDYQYTFTDGTTLVVRGVVQKTTSDSLAADRQEYVLKLAHLYSLRRLGGQKVNKFLKNDTSMAEIINLRTSLEREIAVMRRRFSASPERV